MSVANLDQACLAHIGSFLSFVDRAHLRATSKKWRKALLASKKCIAQFYTPFAQVLQRAVRRYVLYGGYYSPMLFSKTDAWERLPLLRYASALHDIERYTTTDIAALDGVSCKKRVLRHRHAHRKVLQHVGHCFCAKNAMLVVWRSMFCCAGGTGTNRLMSMSRIECHCTLDACQCALERTCNCVGCVGARGCSKNLTAK